MPAWGPISRRKLVKILQEFGFQGPFSGGRHQFMVKADIVRVTAAVDPSTPHGAIGTDDYFSIAVAELEQTTPLA